MWTLRKDILVTFGSMAAVGAVVFGLGFVALSFLVKKKTADSAHAAEGSDPHATDKPAGHGAEKSTAQADKAHGAEKTAPAHGEGDAHAPADAHGENDAPNAAAGHEKAGAPTSEKLKELAGKYNAMMTRGSFEEARVLAAKGLAQTSRDDPEWLQRAADATFRSDDLHSQKRYSKALEYYNDLLNSPSPYLTDAHREWAQWRITLCLKEQMKSEDASIAAKVYLDQFPKNPRRHEVRLVYAQCLDAVKRADEAIEALEKISGKDVPKDVAARALIELGRIKTDRSKTDIPDAPLKIVSGQDAPALKIPGEEDIVLPKPEPEEKTTEPEKHRPTTVPAAEPVKRHTTPAQPVPAPTGDIPAAQWEAIRQAAKNGEFSRLDQLMQPWTGAGSKLNSQQRARVMLNYAKLLSEELSKSGGQK
jgi:tetratricopeptide (TPR) repeat protein